jgi:hypothetical protein
MADIWHEKCWHLALKFFLKRWSLDFLYSQKNKSAKVQQKVQQARLSRSMGVETQR